MGMFEYVWLEGEQWKCPEGHSLEGMEFQTKDFANDCSTIIVKDNVVTMGDRYDVSQYEADEIEIYGDCESCEAYFCYPGNNVNRWVTIRMRMNAQGVIEEWRHSRLLWEQDGKELGGIGPMSAAAAKQLKYAFWEVDRKGKDAAADAYKLLMDAGVPVDLWMEVRRAGRAGEMSSEQMRRALGEPEPKPLTEEQQRALNEMNNALSELYSFQKIESLVYTSNPFLTLVKGGRDE